MIVNLVRIKAQGFEVVPRPLARFVLSEFLHVGGVVILNAFVGYEPKV
jgi:hypothetical protein